jgi:hypothetical protein
VRARTGQRRWWSEDSGRPHRSVAGPVRARGFQFTQPRPAAPRASVGC